MGDVVSGQSFDMIANNKMHSSVAIMRSGVNLVGMLTLVPWAVRVLASIPGVTRDWQRFEIWAEEQVRKRAMAGTKDPDVSSLSEL